MLCRLASACALGLGAASAAERPHIVFVLADDYGHANLGVHRREAGDSPQGAAEAHTPTLDALVDEGILLERHYTFMYCAPSRSSLQSGRLPVNVNVVNTGPLVRNRKDPISGFAGIPRNMTGMASKLRSGGYRTHAVGKWDAGMATPDHTPLGRGYESWLGYYQHANDYWSTGGSMKATGEIDQCFNSLRDLTLLNESYRGGYRDAASFSDRCRRDRDSSPSCYEEQIFRDRALEIIRKHDTSEPLFLFHAFHLVHTPLEVPASYLDRIDRIVAEAGAEPIDSRQRRLYAAMVLFMDETVSAIVAGLKDRGMWANTLLVFASDNGGPVYEPGAANNHPLRGGKFSDFEGGVRSNAFVSGGYVPAHLRGTRFPGVISIADWYGTFCEIAGVDAEDTQAAHANSWLERNGLPTLKPVDSVKQWGFIKNRTNGRSAPLHISETAVLEWPFKLIVGRFPYASWQGPVFPNCSTVDALVNAEGPSPTGLKVFDEHIDTNYRRGPSDRAHWVHDCAEGCLFNVEEDPTEHHDLASLPEYAERLGKMQADLQRLNADVFRPDRGRGATAACEQGLHNGGFFGPFVDTDGWYSEVPEPSFPERLENAAKGALFEVVGNAPGSKTIIGALGYCLGPPIQKVMSYNFDKCLSAVRSEAFV